MKRNMFDTGNVLCLMYVTATSSTVVISFRQTMALYWVNVFVRQRECEVR